MNTNNLLAKYNDLKSGSREPLRLSLFSTLEILEQFTFIPDVAGDLSDRILGRVVHKKHSSVSFRVKVMKGKADVRECFSRGITYCDPKLSDSRARAVRRLVEESK